MKKLSIAIATMGLALGAVTVGAQVGAEGSGVDGGVEIASSAQSAPAQFVPVTPYRAYDSRSSGKLTVGQSPSTSFDPWNDENGDTQIPSGATAVAYNIAAFGTEGVGFITLYGCFDEQPNTAAVNWHTTGVTSNSAGIIAPSVEARETVTSCLLASIGGAEPASTHFTVDITGYFI